MASKFVGNVVAQSLSQVENDLNLLQKLQIKQLTDPEVHAQAKTASEALKLDDFVETVQSSLISTIDEDVKIIGVVEKHYKLKLRPQIKQSIKQIRRERKRSSEFKSVSPIKRSRLTCKVVGEQAISAKLGNKTCDLCNVELSAGDFFPHMNAHLGMCGVKTTLIDEKSERKPIC